MTGSLVLFVRQVANTKVPIFVNIIIVLEHFNTPLHPNTALTNTYLA